MDCSKVMSKQLSLFGFLSSETNVNQQKRRRLEVPSNSDADNDQQFG